MIRSLFVALLLASTGCIPYGYVVPKYTYIPSTPASAPDDVLAFRVDTVERTEYTTFFVTGTLSLNPQEIYLTLLPRESDKKLIPAQSKWSFDKGYLYWPWHENSKSESMAVRLYRRGYKTIELETWPVLNEVQWKRAQSPEAREEAIDSIWGCPSDFFAGMGGLQESTTRLENFREITGKRSQKPLTKLIAEYEQLKSEHTDTRTDQIKRLVARLERKIEFLKSQHLALENKARNR